MHLAARDTKGENLLSATSARSPNAEGLAESNTEEDAAFATAELEGEKMLTESGVLAQTVALGDSHEGSLVGETLERETFEEEAFDDDDDEHGFSPLSTLLAFDSPCSSIS